MEEEPRKLKKLLRRLSGFALSKREAPQIEDIVRQAYELGREDMRNQALGNEGEEEGEHA